MNVLIFVMTLLMLLAMLTYGRLETYRNSQITELFFERYMQKDERDYINKAAEKNYNSIHKSTKGEKPTSTPKIKASPRISLALLFDSQAREKKTREWDQITLMLKNLMSVLYSEDIAYKKLMDERPSLQEDLIVAIVHAIDDLPKEKKMTKATDLAELKLSDPQLNLALYTVLREAPYKQILENTNPDNSAKGKPVNTEESQADQVDDIPESIEDHKSPEGRRSLLDFVGQSKDSKIRVYLASREVLQSIFPDKATVEDIINERKNLYKYADSGAKIEDLSSSFKSQFSARRHGDIDETSLDFSVSKTNPKNYE